MGEGVTGEREGRKKALTEKIEMENYQLERI